MRIVERAVQIRTVQALRRASALALGWVLVGLVSCHEPSQTQQVVAKGVLDRTILDFGEVPVGEWREERVRIRNVGYVPFKALDFLRMLGTPSFVVDLDPGTVPPGGEKDLVVRFHPLQEGELTEQVQVSTDAEEPPDDELRIHGVGGPPRVVLNPSSLDFQTLEVDSDRTLDITVENPTDFSLIASLEGLNPNSFSLDPGVLSPLSTQRVRVRYFPQEVASHTAALKVKVCERCSPILGSMSGKAVPSAFEFTPSPLPFSKVPVHQSTQSRGQMTNIIWRAVDVTGTSTSDASFTALTSLSGLRFQPGESREVEMQFDARYSGPAIGTFNVDYVSDRSRTAQLTLDARGGQPTLAIAPVAIDFGEIPVGGKGAATVRLTNAGTEGELLLLGARGDGPQVGAFSVSQPFRGPWKASTQYNWAAPAQWPNLKMDPAQGIQPQPDALDLQVYFAPDQPGQYAATLTLKSSDMFNPERSIQLTGRARDAGPCKFEVRPKGKIDFGNVPFGKGAVLGFYFENVGTKECALKDIELSNAAEGAFFMPGGSIAGGALLPATAFSAQVAFRPPAPGAYVGELSFTVNDPDQPVFRLPVVGVAEGTCLTAAPNFLDFGPIRLDCNPEPRRTFVSNQCATPVEVLRAWIGEGTSNQYSLTAAPTFPVALNPGDGFELQAEYARNVRGQHYSPLYVAAQGEPPLLVPLLAETNKAGFNKDRFVQGTDNQLDVLFVVSNTTTMGPYQERLKAAIPGFLAQAADRGVDLRAGVTTTGIIPAPASCQGGVNGAEEGRLFPLDGSRARIIANTAPNAGQLLMQNLSVGTCQALEEGLEAMRAALSSPLIDHADDPRSPLPNDGNLGLLRDAARLSVVILSDEDDHSGFDPETYALFVQSIKGPGMAYRSVVNAIVPTDPNCRTASAPGPRFAEVVQKTGGVILSICAGEYGSLLDGLADKTAGLQASFTLTSPPVDPQKLNVMVDGQTIGPGEFHFDAATNAVVFEAGHIPAVGQTVEVEYQAVCGVAVH